MVVSELVTLCHDACGWGDQQVSMVESSRRVDSSILHQFRYAKPVMSLITRFPRFFHLVNGSLNGWMIRISQSLRDQSVTWDESGETFSFLYNERGHQSLRLITVDATTASQNLYHESSDTFVCYSQKTFLHRVSSRNEWIWMSERSGWNHLYLIDAIRD